MLRFLPALLLSTAVSVSACVPTDSLEDRGSSPTTGERAAVETRRPYLCDVRIEHDGGKVTATDVPVAVSSGAENEVVAEFTDRTGGMWQLTVTEQFGLLDFELDGPGGGELELSVPTGTEAFAAKSDFDSFLSLSCALDQPPA